MANRQPQRRNNSISYTIEVSTPTGDMIYVDNIPNLNEVAMNINKKFFNSFDVVSRAMVNNWLYYPQQPRRAFANNFNIRKCAC
tara:strand:- start:120 stop:371 length:252 start_codon:yes stop_codon:yes gene_type:complete